MNTSVELFESYKSLLRETQRSRKRDLGLIITESDKRVRDGKYNIKLVSYTSIFVYGPFLPNLIQKQSRI